MYRCAPAWILFLLLFSSCSRHERDLAPLVEEDQPPYHPSFLNVADPSSAAQLLSGWHRIEQGGWRWTEKQFAVWMKVPALEQPALLDLKFVLPEALVTRLRSITLSARIGAVSLPAQTFTSPGSHMYTQPVPSTTMKGDAVRIDFQLDKALAPGEFDPRELGVVVSSVSLQ